MFLKQRQLAMIRLLEALRDNILIALKFSLKI